jgi:hypothetical protein
MSVHMLRFAVDQADVPAVEAGADEMMRAIAAENPVGVRYSVSRLPDGVTFVGLLELADGVPNPLPGIPECRDFQLGLRTWCAEPPVSQELTVVGTYGHADSSVPNGTPAKARTSLDR